MKRITRFLQRLLPGKAAAPSPVARLMGALAMTTEGEIACDEVYAALDQYAEIVKGEEEVRELMLLVQKHLAMCPDCREEFEGLMAMLEG